MGGLPLWHSHSAHINLVSSQELEEAPLNKSLLLCSCFLHFFRSAWALGTIFRTMGFFGCMKPFESRTSGILSRREKQGNSHISWEKGQTGQQGPYSSHTSQLPLVFNAFPSSQVDLQQDHHYCSCKAATSRCLKPSALGQTGWWALAFPWYKGLGALINRLYVEGRAAKPQPGCCR